MIRHAPSIGLGLGLSLRGSGGVGFRGLLDQYGGAAAAYSLRALSSGWLAGDVVEVRRSSDSTTDSFTASQITSGELEAFCGAGDGFVSTWYDQSGNANDATQATTTAQPKIVSAGALVTGGLDFDGVDDFMEIDMTGINSATNLSTFNAITPTAAAAADTNSMVSWSMGNFNNTRSLSLNSLTGSLSGEKININFDSSTIGRLGSTTYSRTSSKKSLISSFNLSSGTSLFSQGAAVSLDLSFGMTTSTPSSPSDTGYITDDIVLIGAVRGNSPAAFVAEQFQEVIFYSSDQSANRAEIEANINAAYSIY